MTVHTRPLALLALPLIAASLTVAAPAEAATNDLLTIGDSWNYGVGDRDPSNGLGWSPVAASLLGARLTQDGVGGSGYVNRACFKSCGGTFDQRDYHHPAGAYDIVVFQGSTNDKEVPYIGQLAGAANMTLKTAKRRHPNALIVVVGPTAINGSPNAATVKVNDKLRAAAWAADVPFIDAIGEGWFVKGDWSRYSDAATGHPNDAAYRMIGRHIAADLGNLS